MLAASFAAAFGNVPGRGRCLLLREPGAAQEAVKVRQGSSEAYYVVAQMTNACVASVAQPSSDQFSCVAMVQVQFTRAKATFAGRRRKANCHAAQTAFLSFFAIAGFAYGLPPLQHTMRFRRPPLVEGFWWEFRSTFDAFLQLLPPPQTDGGGGQDPAPSEPEAPWLGGVDGEGGGDMSASRK
jgi:hypothetical protein